VPEPLVTVGIVTWNSESDVPGCVATVREQTHRPLDVLVVDNGSSDRTVARLRAVLAPGELVVLERNTGFSGGHNLAIRRTSGEYYLALNPDVRLQPDYVSRIVTRLAAEPQAGSATGRLWLADEPRTIDTTGVYLVPAQRHLDRGQGERDAGQYERVEWVFGASGAAAFYRRAMLDDVAVDGEVFDEDFFAYREDVDLAWRAQWRGWKCLYVPEATGWHRRRVVPDRRAGLPAAVNRMSVRNRFLLRIKNQAAAQAFKHAIPTLVRDAQVIGYCLLREWPSVGAFAEVARLWPRMWRKRRSIMARRRVPVSEIDRWFGERSRPYVATPE
jgi:GT2 family glycosyltransferase